ncbi:MAG: type II toxin-antitoxin system RelE/ParE family toxin [Candidatus Daviesbacteria bacterium]|nr:type II toxin-antitoxin system RelE/ParE family toxin [Candidatus Daviesbacteria bacterium]
MYQLIIRPRAEKHFSRLPQKLQQKIANGLKKLEADPFQIGLDIKKLAGTQKSYRLRVGELRVIYQLDTKIKEISVEDIDFRRTTTY